MANGKYSFFDIYHIEGLMQERRNSSELAMSFLH